MEKYAVLGLVLFMSSQISKVMCFTHVVGPETDQGREPQCYSRFDYEYKVVQKIVALENLCEKFKTTNSELRDEIQDLKDRTESMEWFFLLNFRLVSLPKTQFWQFVTAEREREKESLRDTEHFINIALERSIFSLFTKDPVFITASQDL